MPFWHKKLPSWSKTQNANFVEDYQMNILSIFVKSTDVHGWQRRTQIETITWHGYFLTDFIVVSKDGRDT
jgi:hypothetical protein